MPTVLISHQLTNLKNKNNNNKRKRDRGNMATRNLKVAYNTDFGGNADTPKTEKQLERQ
jgi:hypothetical protein